MKRYSKILLCAVIVTALFLSSVISSSAADYYFDVYGMFSNDAWLSIEQNGTNGVSRKTFDISRAGGADEVMYNGKLYCQFQALPWRESYGEGYSNWGASYASVGVRLNATPEVLEDLNGGRLKSLDLYFFYYIQSADSKYPMTGITLQLDNRSTGGTYLDFTPERVGSYIVDTHGFQQDIYRVRVDVTDDFKIYPTTELKFIMTYSGMPGIAGRLFFGLSVDSTIGITPVSELYQQGVIDSNNNKLDNIQNQVGEIVDDLDTPKPNENDVDSALNNIDVDSVQNLGSLIGMNSSSHVNFQRFILSMSLSVLGVAFIGYVLHGKRG